MLKCSVIEHLTLISGPLEVNLTCYDLFGAFSGINEIRIWLSFSTSFASVRLTHLASCKNFFIHLLSTYYSQVYTCDSIWFRGSLPQNSEIHRLHILITKPTPKTGFNLGRITLYISFFIPLVLALKIDCRKTFFLKNMVTGTKQKQHQSCFKD